jgi:hypothetical protein
MGDAIRLYKQAIPLDPLRANFHPALDTNCTSWAAMNKLASRYKGLRN